MNNRWVDNLSKDEIKEITLAKYYAANLNHDTPERNKFLLISKMADMLDLYDNGDVARQVKKEKAELIDDIVNHIRHAYDNIEIPISYDAKIAGGISQMILKMKDRL